MRVNVTQLYFSNPKLISEELILQLSLFESQKKGKMENEEKLKWAIYRIRERYGHNSG